MAGRIAYYGGIVTNGLILNLDAAKKDSYPGSGTAWRDISGFQNNGTLINGPTFNSNNGGSIVFDGVDDYMTSNVTKSNFPNRITLSIGFRFLSTNSNDIKGILQFANVLSSNTPWILLRTFGSNTVSWYLNGDYRILQTILIDTIYFLDLSYDGTTWRAYKNGIFDSSWVGSFGGLDANFLWIGNGFSGYTNIQVFNTKLYNRTLSAQEVLQNYNATKGRYGL